MQRMFYTVEKRGHNTELELKTAKLLYYDDKKHGFQYLIREWDELPHWKHVSYIVRAKSVIRVSKKIKNDL